MKSVRSRQNFSAYTDNTSCKSSSRKSKVTNTTPFNLSASNRPKRLEEKEDSLEKYSFRARVIPKTHKVPFVVYHSTKSLTSFNNPTMLKCKPSQITCNTKIMAKTPYDELCRKTTEVSTAKEDIQNSESTNLVASRN